jgi:hypothetical protein
MEHKTAAYRHYLSQMHSSPLNPNKTQKEWNTIQTTAKKQWILHNIHQMNKPANTTQYQQQRRHT